MIVAASPLIVFIVGTPLTSPSEGVIPEHSTLNHRSTRERSLFIGLSVSGFARVSGARGGWEV